MEPAASTADFSSIAIVGVGLIGGSLALALRRAGITQRVLGVSSSKTLREAKALGVIDDGGEYDEIADVVANARVVVLCTPISRIIELLPQVAAAVSPGTVVSDVGSTKTAIVACAQSCMPEHSTFIGGHPMAGSEQSGVAASDPFLFQNALYVLTPDQSTPSPLLTSFADGLATTGARVLCLPASAHDSVAAAVSHLPQMLALALVEYVGKRNHDEPAHLQMAAGGFRDMTRIASSPFRMWQDILGTNATEIRAALLGFRDQMDELLADFDVMEPHFTVANETRATIPKDSKGFLTPLCDVLVGCEDKPGELARMTAALSTVGVNIMDIELLKIREGEGGTFRMAFRDEPTAVSAIGALQTAGFSARQR
jgi:prephenate dehydrogenase